MACSWKRPGKERISLLPDKRRSAADMSNGDKGKEEAIIGREQQLDAYCRSIGIVEASYFPDQAVDKARLGKSARGNGSNPLEKTSQSVRNRYENRNGLTV